MGTDKEFLLQIIHIGSGQFFPQNKGGIGSKLSLEESAMSIKKNVLGQKFLYLIPVYHFLLLILDLGQRCWQSRNSIVSCSCHAQLESEIIFNEMIFLDYFQQKICVKRRIAHSVQHVLSVDFKLSANAKEVSFIRTTNVLESPGNLRYNEHLAFCFYPPSSFTHLYSM